MWEWENLFEEKPSVALMVIVTDYCEVRIKPETWQAYLDQFWDRRAPKKTLKRAQDELYRDVAAIARLGWLTGHELTVI